MDGGVWNAADAAGMSPLSEIRVCGAFLHGLHAAPWRSGNFNAAAGFRTESCAEVPTNPSMIDHMSKSQTGW
jgi:hypothetical protein